MRVGYKNWLLPVFLFLIAFFCLPIAQLKGLTMIPGDIGDARLNNYFLENVYQYFWGRSESLWHLSFFYPFPYVLGFSDNLFGTAIVYLIARPITGEPDTSYQIWFLVGYVINFASAYWALRRLGGSILASSVGATIFAFALPTTAHAGHAQLHYRFGIPLAIYFFLEFLTKGKWSSFLLTSFWLVWQFYSGVYMGFFTLLLLGAMFFYFVCRECIGNSIGIKYCFSGFISSWSNQSNREKYIFLSGMGVLVGLLILLFYPYLHVSQLYGVKRSWGEISTMLPRPQSYFLSDSHFMWASQSSRIFSGIPMRHEHQMFMGAIPIALALFGFLLGSRTKHGSPCALMSGMLGVIIVLTIYVGGFSLWYLLHNLPLASSIRAMTRLDQALLFPIAYLSMLTIDQLRSRLVWGTKAAVVIILPLLILEFSVTQMPVSSKESWRQRISAVNNLVNYQLPSNSVLFVAQRSGPFFADELDAMWLAMNRGVRSLNGYSGFFPIGYTYEYGQDCAELPNRVLSYLRFMGRETDTDAYSSLMSRVVPVGFDNCDSTWWEIPPEITASKRVYSASEFSLLKLCIDNFFIRDGKYIFNVKISNPSNTHFAARSDVGRPIRLSWRLIDASGNPLSGWDARKSIPFDVPASGDLSVRIPISATLLSGVQAIEFSIVQELVFWGHDVGVLPARINLN